MLQKFDIFHTMPDGYPLWITAVDGISEAKAFLLTVPVLSRQEYFVFDIRAGKVVPILPLPPAV
jgi:hypothetical protein